MPANKKAEAKPAGPMSKSEFVRTFPLGTSAHLIVKEGQARGYEFTKNFVWTKQNEVRRRLRGEKRSRGKTSPIAAPSASATGPEELPKNLYAEQFIRELILDLGVARADELYRSVREQLRADAKE